MSLGDHFSENFKQEFSERNLKIGAVITQHQGDLLNPKVKRFIVVGFSYDKIMVSAVFINSIVNTNVYHDKSMQDLHYPISKDGREFLDHDSFVDCNQLFEYKKVNILRFLGNYPEALLGEISEPDLKEIKTRISKSRRISKQTKKTYGLFF